MPYLIYLAYFISVVAVFLFARNYFNKPAYPFITAYGDGTMSTHGRIDPVLPKYLIQPSRYNFYCLLFVGIAEIVFLLVANVLDTMLPYDYAVLNPILAACFIIGIINLNDTKAFSKLNRLKWVRPFIDMFKDSLHTSAKIPDKAREVYTALVSQDLDRQSPKVAKLIEATLNDSRFVHQAENSDEVIRPDLKRSDFTYDRSTINRKWARLSYLIHCMQEWERNPDYASALQQDTLEWSRVIRKYQNRLRPQMIKFQNNELDEQEKENLNNEIETTLFRLYRIMTCVAFITSNSSEDLCQKLNPFGFAVYPEKTNSIPRNAIAWTGMSILFAVIVGTSIAAGLSIFLKGVDWLPGADKLNAMEILLWITFGTTMHLVPVILVLSAKRILSVNNYWPTMKDTTYVDMWRDRQWGLYIVLAFAGYVAASVVLSLIAGVLIKQLDESIIKAVFAYSLNCLVTGAFLAYRIDTPDSRKITSKGLFVLGAFAQGLLTMLLMIFSFIIWENEGSLLLNELSNSLLARLVTYSIIAFMVGFFVFISSSIRSRKQVKRKYERIEKNMPVTAEIAGKKDESYTIDISKGGAAIYNCLKTDNLEGPIKIIFNDLYTIAGKIIPSQDKRVIHVQFFDEIPDSYIA